MSSEPPPPSAGLVAGKYEIVRMIGRGGMGSVWEGRHTSLGTQVAIKFIESDYVHSREARGRFDNEARAAATIQSKHAVQIFDHGVTDDGKPYIVMEMLHGEPLDKRLDRLGRLPLVDTARILLQVCRGLGRAHDRGIIHRDLKPENIFLVSSPDDDDEIAKLLDFGIAKIKGPAAKGITSGTKTGAVLGTPYFMSPEQARGLRNVDHRTDIWSIGVIAYRCVTGVLPFDGESVGDLLVKICTAPIPIPSEAAPGIPQSFDRWFSKCLERDPETRFSTVQEAAEALSLSAGLISSRAEGRDPAGSNLPQSPYATPQPTAAVPIVPRPTHAISSGTSAPFTSPTEPVPGLPRSSPLKFLLIPGAIVALGGAVFTARGLMAPEPKRLATEVRTSPDPSAANLAPKSPPPLVPSTLGEADAGSHGTSSEIPPLAPAARHPAPTPKAAPPATQTQPAPQTQPPASPQTKPTPPKLPPANPSPPVVFTPVTPPVVHPPPPKPNKIPDPGF